GETADTIAGQREAQAKGSKTLAICNVLGSMVPRQANGTIYTRAGAEGAVRSTKTFSAQLTGLYLLAVYLGERRGSLTRAKGRQGTRRNDSGRDQSRSTRNAGSGWTPRRAAPHHRITLCHTRGGADATPRLSYRRPARLRRQPAA